MSRTENNYSDRKICCRNCRKFILQTRLDAQILLLENGLILFNCAFWQCPKCGKNDSFISPNLPDEQPTVDNLFPDVKNLHTRAKTTLSEFDKVQR